MRKHIIGILYLIICCTNNLAAQIETLVLPYDATSLTSEQSESNPSVLAYPTAIKDQIPEMRCTSTFTIDYDGHRVEFSIGNLQYQASTGLWRFAKHQWDFVGDASNGTVYENGVKCNNAKISKTYTGWIDLFGWATSGWNTSSWNFDRQGYMPYSTSTNYADYCPRGCEYDLIVVPGTYDRSQADWGVYNQIGPYTPGTWRTLTKEQWEHVLSRRANASSLVGKAIVNNVAGLILLPDEWMCPLGITFSPTTGSDDFSSNVYSLTEWKVLEKNGAIFLPFAGVRVGTTVTIGNSDGSNYWTSTHYTFWNGFQNDVQNAYTICFGAYNQGQGVYYQKKYYGCAVRLVRDVE